MQLASPAQLFNSHFQGIECILDNISAKGFTRPFTIV